MHFSAFSLLPFLALADVALSVCPGFNYAISNVESGSLQGRYAHRWTVYDDSCNEIQTIELDQYANPCFDTPFGCSPPPTLFNKYTRDGLDYVCRQDPNSGVCRGDVISVCCRNDGR
ncbi:hypothetical protein BDN72DRAFT_801831 [Pluteus cervinus]|uniref:Uncharacterized protein n=1 Tax=Pluteus cervinus TaxID=181527 RepID=A0ACD3AHL9_9AGAR|nr:hypothetical protein BDN72DRAFT_801831 [Pluteus cervinus]